jgi:CysZ protein
LTSDGPRLQPVVMLRTIPLVLAQLTDRRVLGVLAKSLALTLLICVVLGLGVSALLSAAFDRWVETRVDDTYYVLFSGLLTGLLVFFGFRVVAIPVIGLFADQVVAAVESRHFPEAARVAQGPGMAQSLRLALMSVVRLIGFNLALLPVYLVLAITGILPFILFFVVNALLLGRDLGEMAAVRHVRGADLKAWLRRSRAPRTLLGLSVSALFLVPFLNLLAPVIGAALATHLFHRRTI